MFLDSFRSFKTLKAVDSINGYIGQTLCTVRSIKLSIQI